MTIDDALLDILVCPIDKRGLLYIAEDGVLYNPRLRRLYPIENGIPRMLACQSVPVPEAEHLRLMRSAWRLTADGPDPRDDEGSLAATIAPHDP